VVRGIFSTGYNELDSLSIYISEAKGAAVFPDPAARFIAVTVRNPYTDLSAVTGNIRHELSGSWYVYTWYQLEKPMYKTFETTKNLLLFIMVLIVLVASVTISSSLVMLVIEKTQEIAVLKALGASPRGISASFVFTGFLIGCVGTFIGLGAGLLVAVNINQAISILQMVINHSIDLWRLPFSPITPESSVSHITILSSSYYLARIPIRLDWKEIGAIAVLSVLLSTSAAWFPARRAAGIRPLEVLRKY
jgi:lipoprotein-releasing system permease protein